MKKAYPLAVFIFLSLSSQSFGQAGEWTWMKGSNSTNSGGYYGTQGVAASNVEPPAAYGAAKWKDLDGNFWVFGGVGYNPGLNNALFKYDPLTNMWTWVKGPSTGNDPGYYGTMGVSSPANNPGARAYGSATWVDMNGDLWLYGGNGYGGIFSGMLADLWKYNIATNEWTWVAGMPNDPSNYGTMSVPAATNTPGEREECTANWVDSLSNLWFYGGLKDGLGSSDGNDMWMFDVGLSQWVWMSGSNLSVVNPNYGTQNVFDANNTPGGRMNYSGWADGEGFFWLFGGENEGNFNDYSDLWKYDHNINQWAWISGSNIGNNNGNAGSGCDTSGLYYPKARFENRAAWLDSCKNFWLFGGYFNGDLNDLWVYQPANNTWAFVGGSLSVGQQGVYGTQGVSAPTNVPGGRMGAVSFYGNDGNLWLFGGTKNYVGSFFNDLWKFVPDPDCPVISTCTSPLPSSIISSSDTSLCAKFCIDFFDLSTNNPTSWQWLFPGGTPSSSTLQNPSNICYQVAGVYDVTLITTNAFGSDTIILTDYITVHPTPPFPVITQTGYTLTSSPAYAYQWQLNSADIPGATNQSYSVLQSGYYTVIITDEYGCISATTTYVLITGIENMLSNASIAIYPNPSNGIFTIEWLELPNATDVDIEISNALGQLIFSTTENVYSNHLVKTISLADFPPGVYFMKIKTGDDLITKKLAVSR